MLMTKDWNRFLKNPFFFYSLNKSLLITGKLQTLACKIMKHKDESSCNNEVKHFNITS